MSSSDNNDQDVGYKNLLVDELPSFVSDKICEILNHDDKWRELVGKHLLWDTITVQNLDKQKNPMKEIIRKLGKGGYEVNEIYILLYNMGHYLGMKELQLYVDKKYQNLLNKANDNLSNKNKLKVQCLTMSTNKLSNNNNNNKSEEKIMNKAGEIIKRPCAPSHSNNLDVVSPNLPSLLLFNSLMTITEIMNALKSQTSLQNIPYKELTESTDNWCNNRVIGKGGFGKVYKGCWKNTDMAIKKIEKKKTNENDGYLEELQQSLGEITTLQMCPHDCILAIYGYSISLDSAPCLVYKFMVNGSLQDRLAMLNGTPPLNWLQRHNIAKFVAQGLQYIHTHIENKPLIHGDIKSANILLDENMKPKIGDFGFARRINNQQGEKVKKGELKGTLIYVPRDYLTDQILSPKLDTYCYGIVMYEIATGLRYDELKRNKKYINNIVENNIDKFDGLIDVKAGQWLNDVFRNLIEVGNWCTRLQAKDRPEMKTVYDKILKCELN